MRIKSAPSVSQPYPRYAACASVKDYGARGDGTADDAVAIQKAVDSVAAGCTIFFPPGMYSLRSSVVIRKDLTFQLAPQCTLRFENNRFVNIVPDAGGARSLTIQGEGPGTSVITTNGFSDRFEPFSVSPGLRFKELRLRNIEVRQHPSVLDVMTIMSPTNIFEISSCLLEARSSVNLNISQPHTAIISSATIVDTEIRPHFSWSVKSPSIVVRNLRVTGHGEAWNILKVFTPDGPSAVSNVILQNIIYDSTGGNDSEFGINFDNEGTGLGKIRATIQSVYNMAPSSRFLRAVCVVSGTVIEITLVNCTFRRSSSNLPPVVLDDQNLGQIHCRMVGCSFTHEGTPNAFPVVSRSLSASSSFVEVGNYQRGWSGI